MSAAPLSLRITAVQERRLITLVNEARAAYDAAFNHLYKDETDSYEKCSAYTIADARMDGYLNHLTQGTRDWVHG